MPTPPAKPRRRRIVLRLLALIFAVFVAFSWHEAQQDPIVRQITFPLAGLPRGTAPLRLALVSDIHVGNLAMSSSRLERIVDQINAQHPDAVLLAGDFVNGDGTDSWDFHPEMLTAPLSRLKAPLGVYAVMGNHDAETSSHVVQGALQDANVTVLNNSAKRLGGIALLGLNDISLRHSDLGKTWQAGLRVGGVPVLLVHSPQVVGWIPGSIPLILTGHTHCGQIRLPGWSNAFDLVHWRYRFDPRYLCGVINEGGRTVIVTGGVGAATLPPLRFNAPPDFWIITLVPKS